MTLFAQQEHVLKLLVVWHFLWMRLLTHVTIFMSFLVVAGLRKIHFQWDTQGVYLNLACVLIYINLNQNKVVTVPVLFSTFEVLWLVLVHSLMFVLTLRAVLCQVFEGIVFLELLSLNFTDFIKQRFLHQFHAVLLYICQL